MRLLTLWLSFDYAVARTAKPNPRRHHQHLPIKAFLFMTREIIAYPLSRRQPPSPGPGRLPGARLGQSLGKTCAKLGQDLGKAWARLGQSLGETLVKSGRDLGKVWARLGQSLGKAAGRPPARPSYHSLVAEDGVRLRFGEPRPLDDV